jgi:hypothetical protein
MKYLWINLMLFANILQLFSKKLVTSYNKISINMNERNVEKELNNNNINSNFNLNSHLHTMAEFRMKTRTLLNELFYASNLKDLTDEKELNSKSESSQNEAYKYYSYDEMTSELYDLAKKYPNFIKVEVAQTLYNLPHPAGHCGAKK